MTVPASGSARKPRRMKPYTQRWKRMAYQVAMCHCPPMVVCKDCGGPRVEGYCCGRCGSDQ